MNRFVRINIHLRTSHNRLTSGQLQGDFVIVVVVTSAEPKFPVSVKNHRNSFRVLTKIKAQEKRKKEWLTLSRTCYWCNRPTISHRQTYPKVSIPYPGYSLVTLFICYDSISHTTPWGYVCGGYGLAGTPVSSPECF